MRGLPIGGIERRTIDVVEALRGRGMDCRIVTIVEEGELFDEAQRRGIPVRFISIPHRTHWQGLGEFDELQHNEIKWI